SAPLTLSTLFPITTLFRSEGVVAGIDEVRSHLRRRDPITTPPQRRHQPRGDGRLAHSRVRARDDEARPEHTHQYSMPFLPFIPRSEEHTSELQSLAYLVCR